MNRKTGSFLAVLLVTSVPAVAQWLNYPTPGIPRTPDGKPNLSARAPKTPNGKPDLSGLWRQGNSRIDSDIKPEDVQPWAHEAARRTLANFQTDFWTAKHFVITEQEKKDISLDPGLLSKIRREL